MNTKKFEMTPKEYIRLRFERLNNPEANKMIANLMREIGKGMYSSKQRMIFELLQNADDAPGKEKVEFHIDINGDYFFIMHDGASFNQDDVEAITSAAESTKRNDNKKTGYKGIGFKSVFTDSTEVWIKSGGYQFAFQRNYKLFSDFDKFYFSSERYRKYPELLEEDKLKYNTQRLKFNGATDIPWQVIPIWKDSLPSEFTASNFNNFNNPVQFALKLGKDNIKEYKSAIDDIVKRPQFLLFLRNTSKFRSPKNGVTVLRNDNEQVINITKSKRHDERDQYFYYTKQAFEDIAVSNEAFSELNIGLKKQSKTNDHNEITYYFTDLHDIEIETIPPKLASAIKTEISFGIPLEQGEIKAEKEYIEGNSKYSSLFTYLPMEDTRFQLPFLVNADFVPSSDRQTIQGDNLWNKYIMIKVAEKHVDTLLYYAKEFATNNLYSTYLSLLLKDRLPDDNTAQQIIDSYNEKYLEELKLKRIIVNDENKTQLLSQTIVDKSELIDIFGHEVFYKIIKTDKKLSHNNLDISYLKKYKYLDVEIISMEKLAKYITSEICEDIGVIIEDQAIYKKPELLKWLDKLVKYMPENFEKIPFIMHNKSLFSLERLLSESDAWIINKNTKDYEVLLESIGYHTINLQLEKYSNINNYLHEVNGYINDKSLAYERLSLRSNLSNLDGSVKVQLIDFLQNSEFMFGIGEKKYFDELKLFVDEKNVSRPLCQLLSPLDNLNIDSLKTFKINSAEYNELTNELKNKLIQKNKVFTSFILNKNLFSEWSLAFNSKNINQYINDLMMIYSWKDESEEVLQNKWNSVPWLYIDDDLRFLYSNKVFWSSAFQELSIENYKRIKNIFYRSGFKNLPLKECGDLIQNFELKTDNELDNELIDIKGMDMVSCNTLLDWMEADGNFSDFFENYTLSTLDGGQWDIVEIGNNQVYDASDESLQRYIKSNEALNIFFKELNADLCSDSRYKIGLLQEGKLLKAIIHSKHYDQQLAILFPSGLDWKLFDDFISNLNVFELQTDLEYDSDTAEHIIINNIIKNVEDINTIPSEIETTVDLFLEKITIDQQPIGNYNLSDIISFGTGNEKKKLKLSDVLPEFDGESNILDNLIESFTAIKQKSKLSKLIFKTRIMSYDEICLKIEEEASEYYSEHQVVFQLLYESYKGKRPWNKEHFDEYWKKKNHGFELQEAYKNFLDILFKLDFAELSSFVFYNLDFKNCVDAKWAIKSERIPKWLDEWVRDKRELKLNFITRLGYNNSDSSIVKFRQAMISEEYDKNTVIRYFVEAKPNKEIISNTMQWLVKYSSTIITKNIDIIEQINNYIVPESSLTTIIIPIIINIDNDLSRNYKLEKISTNNKLYLLLDEDKFAKQIIEKSGNENGQMIFIDKSCGKSSLCFNTETIKLRDSIDIDLLQQNSKLWDELFYKKWKDYSDYPIYIYDGQQIPYKSMFNSIIVNSYSRGSNVEHNGCYYVVKSLKDNIMNNLPDSFPKNKIDSLVKWYYLTSKDESLLDEDSFVYSEDTDRLIQDRLGITKDNQKDESNNAKKNAVYFLKENGFDVSNINILGSALTKIIDQNGNQIDCIVRSAKAGLLYLDKEHWDMLGNDLTYLIVIYPGNTPRLFKERLELLDEKLSRNVLFRIPNSKSISEIDGIFSTVESESHLLLVTSEKMKESLFSTLGQSGRYHKEEDTAIGGDDFNL